MTTCADCGEEIVYTTPATHVRSAFTGKTWCFTCSVYGPPKPGQKRRPVVATTTKTTKAKATNGSASKPDLILAALKAIRALSGVEVIEKKGYFRIAKGGQTVGYLGGNRKVSFDAPTGSGGYEKLSATDEAGLSVITDRIKAFKPKVKEAKQPVAKKAPAKGKSTAKKKATGGQASAAKLAAAAAAGTADDVEVTPDPK